ncbi:MAG: hypothetical protein ACPLW7_00470 [Minisyncoccia bacterium]
MDSIKLENFTPINRTDEINGGGFIGACAGALLGFTYGVIPGVYFGVKDHSLSEAAKITWTSTMLGGGIGAVLPEP